MNELPIQDYIQKRRIKSIFNARDNLHQKRRKIEFEHNHNETGRTELLTAYRSLVSEYLMEVEPLIEESDYGTEIFTETSFGTIKIEPNTRTQSDNIKTRTEIQLQSGQWVMIEPEDIPEKKQYNLTGLKSLHQVPNPISITKRIDVLNPHNSHTPTKETVTYSQKAQISMSTLDLMTRAINELLADLGIKFEVESEPEESEFEYEDLI
jgi:hypothetical protein